MNDQLRQRLNRIYDRITSEDFLKTRGIGNEIAFFVFDYPPAAELDVRVFIRILENRIQSAKPNLRLASVNLFEFVIEYLRELKLLDKCFHLQKKKGDAALLKALMGVLNAQKVAHRFVEFARPHDHELVLVHGLGSVYPLLRTHTLLNNLHPLLDRIPLVLFFPGAYKGGKLLLLGGAEQAPEAHNYYRALHLVD